MRPIMSRLFGLFAVLALLLSFTTASVAHALEPPACADMTTELAIGHGDGGSERPADGDKGIAHHHGGCHGHHVAAPADTDTGITFADGQATRLGASDAPLHGASTDPALRPPQA